MCRGLIIIIGGVLLQMLPNCTKLQTPVLHKLCMTGKLFRVSYNIITNTFPVTDDLEEPDDQERNQVECRVNATFFATLASCHPRCVERRIYDGCFMCDRECNGKHNNHANVIHSMT